MDTVPDYPLEILRERWRAVTIRADRLEAKNAELTRRLIAERATSVKDRVARRYRRQAMLGFVLVPLGVLIYVSGLVSIAFSVFYAAFGVVMAVLGLMYSGRMRKADFISWPTVAALRKAVELRNMQQRFSIFSWCIGGALMAWFVYEIWSPGQAGALIGGCIGLCVGLPIGISKELTNFRLTRKMIEELEVADDGVQ